MGGGRGEINISGFQKLHLTLRPVSKDHQGITTNHKLLERREIYREKLKIKTSITKVNRTTNIIMKQGLERSAGS